VLKVRKRKGYSSGLLVFIILLLVNPASIAVNDKVKNKKNISPVFGQPFLIAEDNNVSLSFWKGESEIKIGYAVRNESFNKKTINSSVVEWDYNNKKIRSYILENGDYEYDIYLKENPSNSIFNFYLDLKNLNAYYQLPLNEEIFDKGWIVNETHAIDEKGLLRAHRPVNIVGSYAIYHPYKRDNQYKTGKVFHIYRPLIIDSKGNTDYGILNYDSDMKMLSINVSREYLDDAVYPVIIDPTFGNTVAGASGWTISDDDVFGFEASPINNGILDNITAHIAITNAETSYNIAGLYNDSDNTFVINSETDLGSHVGDGSYNWETWINSGPKASLLASDNYIISVFHDNTTNGQNTVFHYDNGANNYGHRDLVAVFPTWNDPVVWTWQDVKYFSIYANYTASLTYYFNIDTLTWSTTNVDTLCIFSITLETNSTPSHWWLSHNMSGAWSNETAQTWITNGTETYAMVLTSTISLPIGVRAFGNTTNNNNNTAITLLTTTASGGSSGGEIFVFIGIMVSALMVAVVFTNRKGGRKR
jgi:hypothetical protein